MVPPHARQTGGRARAAAGAVERLGLGQHDRGLAPLAVRHLAAGRARHEPRPALAVEHAHDPTPAAEGGHEPLREQTGPPGVVVAAVDDVDLGPSVALRAARRHDQVAPRLGLERRHGRHEHARHAGSTGPLGGHVTSVPGRGLLLLPRLVVLVEHHHRGHVAHRRPGRGPAAHDGRPGPGQRPVPRHDRHRDPGPAQPQAEVAGAVGRGAQHERVAPHGGGQCHRVRVAGRGQAEHRPLRGERLGQQLVGPDVNRCTGGPGGRQVPHGLVGRGGAQEVRRTPGPAPRGPLGQVDQVLGRTPPGHLGDRLQHPPDVVGIASDVVGHHPPADPSAVQRDPDHRPDAHLVPELVGDQVVEGLVDGRRIRQDPHDPRRSRRVDDGGIGCTRRSRWGRRPRCGWERKGQEGGPLRARGPSAGRRPCRGAPR